MSGQNLKGSRDEIVRLQAERERLLACLEEQQSECAHEIEAAAAAKEAAVYDLSAAQTQAEGATLAGANMADTLQQCRQQLALAQQQNLEGAQVRIGFSNAAQSQAWCTGPWTRFCMLEGAAITGWLDQTKASQRSC